MKKYLIILISLVLFSCTKDGELQSIADSNRSVNNEITSLLRSTLPDPLRLFEVVQEPTNGYFYLTSYATLSTQGIRGDEVLIGGTFQDNGIAQDFGILTVDGSIRLRADARQSYKYESVGNSAAIGLYGRTIPVSLEGQRGLPGFNATLEVPAMMSITSPAYAATIGLDVGTKIDWVPDPTNPNGVAILVYFRNSCPKNGNYKEPSVITPIHTDDDGSYTITASDLAGIPSGSYVKVYIGRANYKRVPMTRDGFYDYVGLATYSVLSADFKRR